jgi:hypothetical protein
MKEERSQLLKLACVARSSVMRVVHLLAYPTSYLQPGLGMIPPPHYQDPVTIQQHNLRAVHQAYMSGINQRSDLYSYGNSPGPSVPNRPILPTATYAVPGVSGIRYPTPSPTKLRARDSSPPPSDRRTFPTSRHRHDLDNATDTLSHVQRSPPTPRVDPKRRRRGSENPT